jgi:CRISP-associated protein Cas1
VVGPATPHRMNLMPCSITVMVFYTPELKRPVLLPGWIHILGICTLITIIKSRLVFDLIEMYRDLVDQTVVYLFTGKKIRDSHFDKFSSGFTLNKEGKAVLISALNEKFDETVRYKNRNIKNIDKIQFDCHEIAQQLLEDGEEC